MGGLVNDHDGTRNKEHERLSLSGWLLAEFAIVFRLANDLPTFEPVADTHGMILKNFLLGGIAPRLLMRHFQHPLGLLAIRGIEGSR